jgi:hypothetical protein
VQSETLHLSIRDATTRWREHSLLPYAPLTDSETLAPNAFAAAATPPA